MKKFVLNTKIYLGASIAPQLKDLNIRRACIVCDPFVEGSGMLEALTLPLEEQGVEYDVFSDVIPDPDIKTVIKGIEHIVRYRPDALIAFGGGSAIDTGKAISFMYHRITGEKKPLCVVIPTTSGTGSEVTSFSVISDSDSSVKYPLTDEAMLPDITFLNPEFTVSVPPTVTADTGMDVLTHALEAYVSPLANDFSDAMAEKAVQLVFENLEKAVEDGSDLQARERLHNASCMAGIAFEHASLGLCHAMAHALGASQGVPHGRCNALLLPHIVKFNADLGQIEPSATCIRYAKIAALLGFRQVNPKVATAQLIREIHQLMDRIGIEGKLRDLPLNEDPTLLEGMAKVALEDRCIKTNPRKASLDEIVAIYKLLL